MSTAKKVEPQSVPLEAHFQVVDPEVQEIVGPPTAYFEIDIGGSNVRIKYVTIAIHAKTRDLVTATYLKYMEELRTALKGRSGSPIIWWRRRPDIEFAGTEQVRIYFRLATSPPLPASEWDRIFGKSIVDT